MNIFAQTTWAVRLFEVLLPLPRRVLPAGLADELALLGLVALFREAVGALAFDPVVDAVGEGSHRERARGRRKRDRQRDLERGCVGTERLQKLKSYYTRKSKLFSSSGQGVAQTVFRSSGQDVTQTCGMVNKVRARKPKQGSGQKAQTFRFGLKKAQTFWIKKT